MVCIHVLARTGVKVGVWTVFVANDRVGVVTRVGVSIMHMANFRVTFGVMTRVEFVTRVGAKVLSRESGIQ